MSKGFHPIHKPPHFFLWDYLKVRVYQEKTRSSTSLKKKIQKEFNSITPSVFKDVMNNFCVRLKICKDLEGIHLEHMI